MELNLTESEKNILWVALREFERTARAGTNHKDPEIRDYAQNELDDVLNVLDKLEDLFIS